MGSILSSLWHAIRTIGSLIYTGIRITSAILIILIVGVILSAFAYDIATEYTQGHTPEPETPTPTATDEHTSQSEQLTTTNTSTTQSKTRDTGDTGKSAEVDTDKYGNLTELQEYLVRNPKYSVPYKFEAQNETLVPTTYHDTKTIDTDNDGIYDYQEGSGVFAASNPKQKDVYVELDYVEGTDVNMDALETVEDLYATAPIQNPNGETGINLHITLGEEIPREEIQSERPTAIAANHSDLYARSHVYAVKTHELSEERLGQASIGAFVYREPQGSNYRHDTRVYAANAFGHELGHVLGLVPEEFDGIDAEKYSKTEYESVMNYNLHGKPITYSSTDPHDDWAVINSSLRESTFNRYTPP